MTLLSVDLTPVPPFPQGHQNWMIPENRNAVLDTTYYRQCVLDTDGILYTVAWLDMESAQGVYDFSTIITALDYAASKGKNVIVRIFYKTYVAAHPKPLPAYILSDHATYG
ncbi:MAG: hypothetical protein L0H37_04100, partial [Nitrosospira sp.]|nr:hypothetical protein [Nitrosospira sp.]